MLFPGFFFSFVSFKEQQQINFFASMIKEGSFSQGYHDFRPFLLQLETRFLSGEIIHVITT